MTYADVNTSYMLTVYTHWYTQPLSATNLTTISNTLIVGCNCTPKLLWQNSQNAPGINYSHIFSGCIFEVKYCISRTLNNTVKESCKSKFPVNSSPGRKRCQKSFLSQKLTWCFLSCFCCPCCWMIFLFTYTIWKKKKKRAGIYAYITPNLWTVHLGKKNILEHC